MGFAVFEDTELVDYGVKSIRQGSKSSILQHIDDITKRWIKTLNPDYLILEKNVFSQIQYNLRLLMVITQITKTAEKNGIRHYEYDPRAVRKVICNDGNATKKRVSEVLITYFPELIAYMKSDKAWVIKYNQNMFDAVAVGMTFIKQHINSTQPIRKLFWRK
jgi:Holliday junction resolvasome RuvABC endonuclease subunit